MRWIAPGALLAVLTAAPPAAAAGSAGLELEIGMARGPFRYEGLTGDGSQATAETDFQSLALNLAAHGGFELAPDYFAGLRLGAGMLPTLEGGVQSTDFNAALHARAELAAWSTARDAPNIGVAVGVGTMALAYSVEEGAQATDVRFEDEALYGPLVDLWVAHPFGAGWSVGAIAGFAWLTSEHARFAMFSAALRVSYEAWRP
jgi:hypothetical protein